MPEDMNDINYMDRMDCQTEVMADDTNGLDM